MLSNISMNNTRSPWIGIMMMMMMMMMMMIIIIIIIINLAEGLCISYVIKLWVLCGCILIC